MTERRRRTASAAETALAQTFQAIHTGLPGNGGAAALRAENFDSFIKSGLPTRRVEAWHYTDLRAAMQTAFPLAGAPDADAFASAGSVLSGLPAAANRIVLVDGTFCEKLSRIADGAVSVTALEDALAAADPAFVAEIAPANGSGDAAVVLNAAMMGGGAVIGIAAGATVAEPLEIVTIATRRQDAAFFVRTLVRAGNGSAATIVERHVHAGTAGVQINGVVVVRAGEKAQVDHVFLQDGQGEGLVHVATMLANLAASAQLKSFALVDTGAFVRRQVFSRFEGAEATLDLSGLMLVRNRDHNDTTLVVEHIHPDCISKEYFKHIVDGSGTGVFQGKVSVRPEAQKTDGSMKSQTILLSDDAAMYNKPELEIFADDVACSHGATCGSLDTNQLFYAMARGLPKREAEALLLEAFGADAIGRVANEGLRAELRGRLQRWLGERKG
ncbi:MAG: Fe-S cluster assembly protein SufD [Beijerinckiaceae bacterium]